GAVGRIVARAAAEHLTPTVLELGGKSPVFVDEGADPATTAARIVWGKFTNAGLTCIAPDHLMATPRTLERLRPHLLRAVRAMYGRPPARSLDYGRMVSDAHFERVRALIDDDKAILGGTAEADPATRYLPPTILEGVDWDDPVMGEEIFGPVLPLLAVPGPDEAIARRPPFPAADALGGRGLGRPGGGGGDLRPRPAAAGRLRPGRGDRADPRGGRAADRVRVLAPPRGRGALRGRDLLRLPRPGTDARPRGQRRHALRRGGGLRHGRLSRPHRGRGVHPRQAGGAQAALARHPEARLPALHRAQ